MDKGGFCLKALHAASIHRLLGSYVVFGGHRPPKKTYDSVNNSGPVILHADLNSHVHLKCSWNGEVFKSEAERHMHFNILKCNVSDVSEETAVTLAAAKPVF